MRTRRLAHDSHCCEAPPWLAAVVEVAAHELGNHLTALSFLSEMMRGEPGPERSEHDAENVHALIAQSASLVRALTWLSTRATPPVALDAREAALELEPLLQRLANGALRFEDTGEAAPLFVSRSRLVRALIELVLAARAHASSSEPIVVRIGREEAGADGEPAVRIAVEGRASDAPLPAASDLPSARDLAELADGSVCVRTLPDARAAFSLVLPLDAGEAPVAGAR
ncbi:MAG: hypothetical protein DCC71_12380 [Proteobacteria bacterium]|nr:MAG: hypothetical protein DCC71_12380 [Pseudomonadota bacterium]